VVLAAQAVCARCGRPDDGASFACGLCGEVLRRAPESARAPPAASDAAVPSRASWEARPVPVDRERERRARAEPWFYLGLGLVIAPIFAWTPLLQYMGWFLASLVHEMGHSAVAWFCGMPAFPAIALDGHAAAVHGPQLLFLVALIAGGMASFLWKRLEGTRRIAALIALGILYPALAFTSARELAHLVAGHGGELAFATLCLWKALDGGFTESRAERLAYGVVGWYLAGKNLFLFGGLFGSAASRAHYAENGSFGMTNDMIRVAEDVLGWRLESVALVGVLVSLCVLPAALWLWRLSHAARTAD
jgi:hypothetical protein